MSNLDIFKIGVGPSSSHTLGPMLAANMFCKKLDSILSNVQRVECTLYGSLSLTGKGHLSDKAVIWGLNGLVAKDITQEIQQEILDSALKNSKLNLCGSKEIEFIYERDIIFNNSFLELHQNALILKAYDKSNNAVCEETYYSVGGGFVKTDEQMRLGDREVSSSVGITINSTKDILALSDNDSKSLANISYEYELQFHTREHIYDYCLSIWEVMQECYERGCNPKNLNLPGPLNLHRRAKGLRERIHPTMDPFGIIDYISLYSISIAEENAGGGRVVTAPTNGACAVIPSVMLYLKNHSVGFSDSMVVDFLLCAMLIGSLYKKNASISGAEAGCQAEIGAASSMAAAAMATVLGANTSKACNAAEIAMEHHLGLTCDPAFGLVQIPCIERNAFGAIKAISAARMAMNRKSEPVVGLDEVIKTMYETGKDMSSKYKETALGGLAKTLGNSVC